MPPPKTSKNLVKPRRFGGGLGDSRKDRPKKGQEAEWRERERAEEAAREAEREAKREKEREERARREREREERDRNRARDDDADVRRGGSRDRGRYGVYCTSKYNFVCYGYRMKRAKMVSISSNVCVVKRLLALLFIIFFSCYTVVKETARIVSLKSNALSGRAQAQVCIPNICVSGYA